MWSIFKLIQASRKGLCCGVAILCSFLSALLAQAPLTEGEFKSRSDNLMIDWKMKVANQTLRAGLPALAVRTYDGLLKNSDLDEAGIASIRINLAASYIAQRDFAEAKTVLGEIPEAFRNSNYWLYWGVAQYGRGRQVDVNMLSRALKQIRLEELEKIHRPWFHLLRGLEAELSGNTETMEAQWKKAEASAVTDIQRAFFKGLILRGQIMRTPSDEALAIEVRGQLQRLEDEAAYPYVREYAIILYNMGRQADAVDVLDQQLHNTAATYKSSERGQLRLLRALILGPDSSDGRFALRELVRNGQNREVMEVALQLLARADVAVEELSEFLSEIISRAEPHLLLGQMYYMRSQLALSRDEITMAESDARYLLEQFPGLNQITNVYHLLAYAAIQHEPPRYRIAADLLIQLRDQDLDKRRRWDLNILIGDCYFLNEDYSNAADFYRSVLSVVEPSVDAKGLYMRLITAELRAGEVDAAIQYIDQGILGEGVDVNTRWQAEWNVAQALLVKGEQGIALKRLQAILTDDSGEPVATTLDLRIRWLKAYLNTILNRDEVGLIDEVDALLSRIESLPFGVLDEGDARLLITESLILKADILFGIEQASAGIELLERLRTDYAMSSAAERSYMTEANYYALIGDFKAAQNALVQLATLYPDSLLAAKALFEAALYCERRGPAHYVDAIRLHHDLTDRFPDDDFVYAACLKQGDLLRQMNDFSGAQIIYETLIHSQPEHPRRYVAELSRVECMLALARNKDAPLKSVAISLEQLMNVPNLPVNVQAEVAYKWGFALMQMEAAIEAIEIFTLAVDQFLLDPNSVVQLGEVGRYWTARAMLDLGGLLEELGESAEARRIYRKIVAYNLPGRSIAQARASSLPISNQ